MSFSGEQVEPEIMLSKISQTWKTNTAGFISRVESRFNIHTIT